MGVKGRISRDKVRELHKRGLADSAIAKKLNCCRRTVMNIRKELGLKTKRFISREMVRKLHGNGKSDPEIARELNACHASIWKIRNRELGLKANRSSWRTIDHDKLWEDYQNKMSLDELAEKYGYESIVGLKRAIGRIHMEKTR